MALGVLVRINYGGKFPLSIKCIKCHYLYSFKERVIILEARRISHLPSSTLFIIPLNQLYTSFLISNTFISNVKLKLAKFQANAKQHPEAELYPRYHPKIKK